MQFEWIRRHEGVWTPFEYAVRSQGSLLWKIRNYWRFALTVKRGWRETESICWERTWVIHWEVKVRETREEKTEERKREENFGRIEAKGGRGVEEVRRGIKVKEGTNITENAGSSW